MENQMITGTRVDCLYRVSTDKQVDHNDKNQTDEAYLFRISTCHSDTILNSAFRYSASPS